MCAYLYLCGGDVAGIFSCQLFEQSGLASIVQAKQQQAHLLFWSLLQPPKNRQQALQVDQLVVMNFNEAAGFKDDISQRNL